MASESADAKEAGTCPPDDVVAGWLDGSLDARTRLSVDAHIDGCTSCRELIATLGQQELAPPSSIKPPSSRDDAAAAPIRVGDTIGRYVVVEWVGAGGMGAVYAAYDPKLGRKIALKLLTPRLGARTGGSERARLLREANAMAQVGHPNVVAVFDAGAHDDQVFVAMEFVDGQTLREWLEESERSAIEILTAFLEAARGLHAAHEAGFVHRDFKPDNVLVDGAGRVRVTDFGLAREVLAEDLEAMSQASLAVARRVAHDVATLADGEADTVPAHEAIPVSPTQLTVPGVILGTPAYMAPEQFAHGATPRSDQFSFAVSLYEALYGQRPFDFSRQDVSVATEPEFAEHPEYPEALVEILRRALAFRPRDRFGSMIELIDAIESRVLRLDDSEVGRRIRVRAGAILFCMFATIPVLQDVILGDPFSTWSGTVIWTLVDLGLLGASAAPFHRRLRIGNYNTRLVTSVALAVASRGSVSFAAWQLGLAPSVAHVFYLVSRQGYLAMIVLLLERRVWPSAIAFFFAFVIGSLFPASRYTLIALTDIFMMLNFVLVWQTSAPNRGPTPPIPLLTPSIGSRKLESESERSDNRGVVVPALGEQKPGR